MGSAIAYLPMRMDCTYLVAIPDLASRKVPAFRLWNALSVNPETGPYMKAISGTSAIFAGRTLIATPTSAQISMSRLWEGFAITYTRVTMKACSPLLTANPTRSHLRFRWGPIRQSARVLAISCVCAIQSAEPSAIAPGLGSRGNVSDVGMTGGWLPRIRDSAIAADPAVDASSCRSRPYILIVGIGTA